MAWLRIRCTELLEWSDGKRCSIWKKELRDASTVTGIQPMNSNHATMRQASPMRFLSAVVIDMNYAPFNATATFLNSWSANQTGSRL